MGLRLGLLTLIIAGTLCSTRAFAEDGFGVLSGNKLFDYCQKEPNSCSMYIAGVSDVLLLAHVICTPDKMSRGQAVDLVVSELQAHPEFRNESAASTATIALKRASPCNNTKK
jgi:hypothetical protein